MNEIILEILVVVAAVALLTTVIIAWRFWQKDRKASLNLTAGSPVMKKRPSPWSQ